MATRKWKTREEYRKEKELEEARKAGTAAPEVDEDGRDINPHIPQYIAQAPWYVDKGKPGLKHQRVDAFGRGQQFDDIGTWYQRGQFQAAPSTKYRKGSCANCGAMTHSAKYCVERPRKIGAKFSQQDIKPDEIISAVQLDYDGKRDRWNGWDSAYYKKIMDQYEKTDVERRKKKAEEQAKKFMTEPDPGHQRYPHHSNAVNVASSDPGKLAQDSDEDDFRDKEINSSERFTKKDPKTRTTIRNLRIREDTAKYLRNLDPNSAFYDPKSRSMRENPHPDKNPEEVNFAGDNFARETGEALEFNKIRSFAWESATQGPSDVHLQAAPSQVELMFQKDKKEKEVQRHHIKQQILEQYGGEEHFATIPKELLIAQTENYVEYTQDGKVIRGQEEVIPSSKYPENIFINDHTRVWGSYWSEGKWGYACCRATIKNSYCSGEPRTESIAEGNLIAALHGSSQEIEQASSNVGASTKTSKREKKKKSLKKSKKRKRDELEEEDDRARGYNSFGGDTIEVTEEDMERYKQKRINWQDPMKAFLGAL